MHVQAKQRDVRLVEQDPAGSGSLAFMAGPRQALPTYSGPAAPKAAGANEGTGGFDYTAAVFSNATGSRAAVDGTGAAASPKARAEGKEGREGKEGKRAAASSAEQVHAARILLQDAMELCTLPDLLGAVAQGEATLRPGGCAPGLPDLAEELALAEQQIVALSASAEEAQGGGSGGGEEEAEQRIQQCIQLALDRFRAAAGEAVGDAARSKSLLTAGKTLSKLLENLCHDPEEPRYRKVRLSNKAINERLVRAAGGAGKAVLLAVGFVPFTDSEGEAWLCLPTQDAVDAAVPWAATALADLQEMIGSFQEMIG